MVRHVLISIKSKHEKMVEFKRKIILSISNGSAVKRFLMG